MTETLFHGFVVVSICWVVLFVMTLWERKLYHKAVKQLAKREEEIQELKVKNMELKEQIDREEMFSSAALFGSNLIGPKLSALQGKSININGRCYPVTDYSIKVNTIPDSKFVVANTKKETPEEFMREIFEDKPSNEIIWRVPFTWRNNTYEELNNAMKDAAQMFDLEEFRVWHDARERESGQKD